MVRIITPDDNTYIIKKNEFVIFLGGTIENGLSKNWQEDYIRVISELCDRFQKDIVICNPRREKFHIDEIEKQIQWELNHLDRADIVLMNLLSHSASPISLMELGAYKEKIICLCKKNFYRYLNVYLTCQHHNIKFTNNENKFKKFISDIIKMI